MSIKMIEPEVVKASDVIRAREKLIKILNVEKKHPQLSEAQCDTIDWCIEEIQDIFYIDGVE